MKMNKKQLAIRRAIRLVESITNKKVILKEVELTPTNGRKSFFGKVKVEDENGEKVLYSYGTKVASYGKNGLRIYNGDLISAITASHIRAFLDYVGIDDKMTRKQMQALSESKRRNLKESFADAEIKREAKKIVKRFTPKLLKIQKDEDGWTVLVGDKKSDITFWVDVYEKDGELEGDWNKYIFHKWKYEDVLEQELQTYPEMFESVVLFAINEVENTL